MLDSSSSIADISPRLIDSIDSVIERSASWDVPVDIEVRLIPIRRKVELVEPANLPHQVIQGRCHRLEIFLGKLEALNVVQATNPVSVDHVKPPSMLRAWPVT